MTRLLLVWLLTMNDASDGFGVHVISLVLLQVDIVQGPRLGVWTRV